MSRKEKSVSDKDAREITEYLLNKGITQVRIANTVKRSQSWVASIKREVDIIDSAKEQGRHEIKEEILNNIENKVAKEIANGISHAPILSIENNQE